MGFVGYQDDAVLSEVFKGDGVLSLGRQIGVEFLDGRETDVDVVVVDTLKVSNRCHGNLIAADMDGVVEKVFGGVGIEKVVLCLFDDVGGIDEEEEVAITLLVEVENQTCHDEGFAAAGCHVEEKMQGMFFSRKAIVQTVKEACKCLSLVWAQLEFGV